ncbi:MAG: hypothetical protein OEL57_12865 [Trichlorobacter sp.]|uniref:hypothetical protein n=1 Tax=Trichlorobacter sp. TaxID=2911007 RepID=UPI00255DB131|nr:hypothetical protein [Trichlorobacter sp.]MDK9718778.1 hypothetical protein [Trichlorobacter sp.]
MKPYANESETIQIADLTIENRTDRVSLHGSLDLTRDCKGLAAAHELKAVVDAVVTLLEKEASNGKLPEEIVLEQTVTVDNPFA